MVNATVGKKMGGRGIGFSTLC